MSGKYSVDDLLKLRASPLICKPANLPAIEEILSASDSKPHKPSARRGADDANGTAASEGFPKRPLLDSNRKSTTDPDRLVLGPPRKSFASSNPRSGAKGALEPTDENAAVREKGVFDRLKSGDPDRHLERRINGRFSKHDADGSADEKHRRRLDDLDVDTKSRRDHDRKPNWAADDDGEKESRPERPSRAKFERSWLRPDRGTDALEDPRREGERTHGWRDKRQDRGWERPGQALVEDDPEWMDAPIDEEEKLSQTPARTQEDFQRWKDKMRAGKSAPADPDPEELPAQPSSPLPIDSKFTKPSAPILDAEPDDSMDKFFARFNDTKITSAQPTVTAKAPTKSRFGSLFSPPPEPPQQKPAPSPQPVIEPTPPPVQHSPRPPPEVGSDASEAAGFARILEMLNTRPNNPPPKTDEPKVRVPLYARDSQPQPELDRSQQPPGLMALFGPPQSTARQHQIVPQERVQETRSPIDPQHGRHQSQKTDTLLDLLRQANQAAKPTPPPPRYNAENFHGMMTDHARLREMANQGALQRNQMISSVSPPDPSVMAMLGRSENGRGPFIDEQQRMQYEALARRPTNGEADQSQQDPLLSFVRGFNQPQRTQQPQAPPPPGLGRPPGFDQMARPPQGWPAQPVHPQHQQQPRQPPPGPPPGMSGPPRTQFGGPGVLQQQPQPQQRPQPPPQRKYTGEFPPPGAALPPGFMGAPPGFPGYAGPQGLSRPQFMDMYGGGDGRGMRGNAAGGMPGYR